MLDYPLLAALAAVVREGGFERAAAVLHVTPSAISQRIKLLEERLGTALVVRGRPCVATPAGLRLCRHVEQVGLLESELVRALPELPLGGADAVRPVLRVAINADSLAAWFMPAWAEFAAGDDALLDVLLDDQDHTAELLQRGEVLAAVSASARALPGCRVRPLGAIRYAATASPALLARHFAGGVDAASLARAPMLVFNAKDRLQSRWLRAACRRELEPPAHRVPSTQAFVDGALAGLGWGMNPLLLVAPLLRQGRLVELVPGLQLDVPLYWHQSRLAVPALQRLEDCVLRAAVVLDRLSPPAPRRSARTAPVAPGSRTRRAGAPG